MNFDERVKVMRNHYETIKWKNRRVTIFTSNYLPTEITKHHTQSHLDTFNACGKEWKPVMRGIGPHASNDMLRQRIINMCIGVKELQETLLRVGDTAEKVATSNRERLLQLQQTSSSSQQFILGYGYIYESRKQ